MRTAWSYGNSSSLSMIKPAAMLGRLARQVNLRQQFQLAAPAASPFIQSRRDSCIVDPAGEVLLWCGLGIYPNTRYMDGFAICWHEGLQRNVRCGREREGDLWRLHAGPMRFDVVEPLRVWRLALDDASGQVVMRRI